MNIHTIFLISCFFPFVSPYPINSDIQPIAGILAFVIILKNTFYENKFIPLKYFIVVLFSLVFLTYNSIFLSFNPDYGKMLSLTFGSLILLGFYFSRNYLNARLINTIVIFYFLWSILLLLFPENMIVIQNLFIRDTNSVDFSYRGIATLTTEPGLFGGVLVFLLIIVDHMKFSKLLSIKNQCFLYLCILIMLFLTKSGTGYLYFLFFLLFKFLLSNIKLRYKFFLSIIFLVGFFTFLNFLSSIDIDGLGRGIYILSNLSNLETLLNTDTSIFIRIVDVYLSFISLVNYPFGVGNGYVNEAFINVVKLSDFANNFYTSNGKNIGVNSSFTYLTLSYGILFWFYLLFIFFILSKSNITQKFFAFLFLAVSYSSAFPAIWILLGLTLYKTRAKYPTK